LGIGHIDHASLLIIDCKAQAWWQTAPSFSLEGNIRMMNEKIDTLCYSEKYEQESTTAPTPSLLNSSQYTALTAGLRFAAIKNLAAAVPASANHQVLSAICFTFPALETTLSNKQHSCLSLGLFM
jgi:hypothetical protein